MNRKKQIVRILKLLKLHLIKRRFLEVKNYLFLSNKYGVFSGQIVSFNDLENENILYSHKVDLFYSPPVFDDENPSVLIKGMTYNQYAVKLKNVAVLGISSIIPMSSGKVLYDLPFYDTDKRFYYSDYKILKLKNKRITYWKGKGQTIDKAVSMCSNYSWNFYHFIYEIAIKFCKLNELNIPSDIPVLVDQMCLDIPQCKEILDMLNEKGRPLVSIAQDGFFEVNELFYINCPNFIPPNNKNDNDLRPSDVQFDIEAVKNLRNFLLPYASLQNFPKRIFISRKVASGRRQFNEEELIQVAADFGFEVVFPEKLSFCEQIALFSRAEWIIGGSGAAFANLLFCKENSKALILFKRRLPFSGFATIARISNMDIRYITEESNEEKIKPDTKVHDPFKIKVPDFRKYLNDNVI